MSGDDAGWAVFYGLMLLLPLSSLVARRIDWRRGGAMALGWVALFGIAVALVSERERFAAIARDVRRAFDPEAGERQGAALRIPMADDGHFWVRAQVNGRDVRFLIDSGATTTALGAQAARDVGIAPATGFGGGFGVALDTANGTVIARRATIGKLDVGGIVRTDIGAVVAPEFGETNVLGMNFLSSLSRWGVEGRTLVLIP